MGGLNRNICRALLVSVPQQENLRIMKGLKRPMIGLIVLSLIVIPLLNLNNLPDYERLVLSPFQLEMDSSIVKTVNATSSSTSHEIKEPTHVSPRAIINDEPKYTDTKYETTSSATSNSDVLVVSSTKEPTPILLNDTIGYIKERYNSADYQRRLEESLRPITNQNVTTYANMFPFFSGFCNQYMYFAGIFFFAIERHIQIDQILVESFSWKDTLATNSQMPHVELWDVVHWNTHYPVLPRFVRHVPDEFPDIQLTPKKKIVWNIAAVNATKPYALGGNTQQPSWQYKSYIRHLDANQMEHYQSQHKIMQTIAKGALRPHPAIQEIINHLEDSLNHDFMAIHTRIEPDMLVHPLCRQIKVNNVSMILDMIYEKYPEPPVKNVLLIFNRPLIEARVSPKYTGLPEDLKALSKHNLAVIDDMVKNGMWNGTVHVKESGANMVMDMLADYPVYMKHNSIVGAVVSFFTALNSKIFIGTEISTYSTLAATSRFYRENRENYFYYPTGLQWVTDLAATKPPKFKC